MINAKVYFYKIIKDLLSKHNITSVQTANDNKLKNCLRIFDKTGIGFSIKYLNETECFGKIKNEETKIILYGEKFKCTDSYISYINKKGNPVFLKQVFIYDKVKKELIINLIIKQEKLSIQQLICPNSECDNFIEDKCILKEEVTIVTGFDFISSFISYTNLKNNSLLVENYKKYYFYDERYNHIQYLESLFTKSKDIVLVYDNNKIVDTKIQNLNCSSIEVANDLINVELLSHVNKIESLLSDFKVKNKVKK